MPSTSNADQLLVARIRAGETPAWDEFISRFEGRLLAFVESRIGNRSTSEDVVQEAFIGFVVSLPNYDAARPLESYLFSIAAHKLTDHMRREGRRPAISLNAETSNTGSWEVPGSARHASSIHRSQERRRMEDQALTACLEELVEHWRNKGDWTKLKCIELLFVGGWANKDTAEFLEITEQQVANFKFDFIARLRSRIRKQGLSGEIFPELYEN